MRAQIRYDNRDNQFLIELKKEVNEYFKKNHLSKHANMSMVLKSIFMFLLYLVPYFFIISGFVTNKTIIMFLWILMGLGMTGLGMSVMHDANHGAYSANPRVNLILGHALNLIGGHIVNWRIQHNYFHHSFTNVDGYDEDISTGGLLRLSPKQPAKKIYRFQQYYAWFFYSITTIFWITVKDFTQLARYNREGLLKKEHKSYSRLMTELVAWKAFYWVFALGIPMLLSPVPWWNTILFFLLMHLVTGLTLTNIFQLAHIMPTSGYPKPDKEGNIDTAWAVHQLVTTTDFHPRSRVFSWLIGGLNYQVEHHLFPNVCHVHYKKISPIVKKITGKYNLPYYVQPSLSTALRSHFLTLKKTGALTK